MRIARPKKSASLAVVSTAALVLSGCGSGGLLTSGNGENTTPEPQELASSTASESANASEAEASGAQGQPDWAEPITTPGDKIATIEVGDIAVDVHQVGTAKATETGNYADPETNEPIIAVGDELIFVNYVVTNNGDPVDLGASLMSIDAEYKDWQYLQGMDSVTDNDLFEQQNVNHSAKSSDAYQESGIYTFGEGERYSYGDNFLYQKNSPITFEARYTPVDSAGELVHDKRIEGEAEATIK